MPPQVGKAGDPTTNVNLQAPIKIEESKTKALDNNAAQQPPNLDPKTVAKNYEAAKQHANDTKNQDTARVQIIKNQLAQKLPDKKMPDGQKIFIDNNAVYAGPVTQDSIPSPRQPANSGPPVSVITAKGAETISTAEYERRYRAASDYVKREASASLKPGEDGVERLATIRKQAAKTFGLPEDWSLAKNDPQVWKAKEIAEAKFKNNSGPSNGQGKSGSVDPKANTQPPVDPHANTQPRVDPHANTQPRVNAYAKTEAQVAAKAGKVAEEGAVAGKAVGATEKAVSTGVNVAEGASTGVKITSAGARVAGAVTHMLPVMDGLMAEFDYFTSYAKAHDIIRTKNTESGFAVGMAASLMGASPKEFGLSSIDKKSATVLFLGAEGIAEKSHNKGVADGYKYAQSLSINERNRLRNETFKALAAKGYRTENPNSFADRDVYHAAGVMLPGVKKLFEEARKQAEAEALRIRKEKNPSYGSRF